MKELRDKIIDAFYKKLYSYFFELFKQYMDKGCAIDSELVNLYIKALINTNKYDKAYKMLKWYETYSNRFPSIDEDLFVLYYFCCKPQDAERIYKKGNVSTKHKTFIVRNYLLQGKINEAKEILLKFIAEEPSKELFHLHKLIYNHEHLGSFIETDYESFIRNGNKLMPGHVVYLKHEPEIAPGAKSDDKISNRPYMVWKIDGGIVYLFPVSTSIKPASYILMKSNYPNSVGDRTVKNQLCSTGKRNILSVSDKLRDFDYNASLKNIYISTYLNRFSDDKKHNDAFMQSYHRDVEKYEVIKTVDLATKQRKYYFVVCINDKYYEVIEVDEEMNVISNKIGLFKKDTLFLTSFSLTSEYLEKINSQLEDSGMRRTFVGATVETGRGKYIVLCEKGDNCLCISTPYSPSYIRIVTINKNEIRNTLGFKTDEEVEEIKDLASRNSGTNFLKLYKKL